MGINGAVSCSTCQILSFSKGNVFAFRVLKALGKTKINDINIVFSGLITANKEIVWFDITMNNSLIVNLLDSLIHLHSNMEDSSQVKLSSALLEKIFKTLTKLIHDHDMVHLTVISLLITNKV